MGRWDPYIKNADVPKEKWELIDEAIRLYDPPKLLRAKMRQQLKGCTMEGLRSRIARLKANQQ